MPIDKDEILERIEKIEKEDADAKNPRKDRKKFWKEHSLEESLYNTVDGKKIPRAQDVDQCSYSNLNYLLKGYGISDCYLLSNLMGLAKNQPNLIMKDLITVINKDLVEVKFFNVKLPPIVKLKNCVKSVTLESEGEERVSVSKDEALKWKTCHKALWVVAIEIAYAKYLKDSDALYQVSKCETLEVIRQSVIQMHNSPNYAGWSENDFSKLLDNRTMAAIERLSKNLNNIIDLRKVLDNSIPSMVLVHLTGSKSKYKMIIDDNIFNKKFNEKLIDIFKPSKYSMASINIYNKIGRKCAAGKVVSVGFKGVSSFQRPKVDKNSIALQVIAIAKYLKSNAERIINNLENNNMLDKNKCSKWLDDHGLDVEGLSQSSDSLRKQFAIDLVNFERQLKISKNSSDILSEHSYLILDVLEHKGYKYVILKNPHNMETKIGYHNKRKNGIPKEVELPSQIDKEKNECMMELNHFCKKLDTLFYDK